MAVGPRDYHQRMAGEVMRHGKKALELINGTTNAPANIPNAGGESDKKAVAGPISSRIPPQMVPFVKDWQAKPLKQK